MQNPEVRRHMADMILKHWGIGWICKCLGAEHQAKRSGPVMESKAKEALLAQAERSGENDPDMGEINREGTRLIDRPSSGDK